MALMQFYLESKRELVWNILRGVMAASLLCALLSFIAIDTSGCNNNEYFDCTIGAAGVAQIFNVFWLIGILVVLFILPSGDSKSYNPSQTEGSKPKEENEETEAQLDAEAQDKEKE